MHEMRTACTVLARKPHVYRQRERRRHRSKYNIKMDVRERGCKFEDWIELDRKRVQLQAFVKIVMNLRALNLIRNF
jgi:hypothetical protein